MSTMKFTRVVVIAVLAGATAAVSAQPVRTDQLPADAQLQQRRFQFQLMEAVLENAVRQGATEVAMRAQMTLPIGTLFMGPAKATGFPLDGFGLVFHIEIPVILESQVLLSQMVPPTPPAQGPTAVSTRGAAARPTTRAAGVVPEDPMARSPIVDPFLADPNAFYRMAVRDKLVDVILDHSRSLSVATGEWLSVAARSAESPGPNSLQDDSRTLILRIKGEDLAAFHASRITRDEARKRIVESQF
ncbi:MAG: hypothetical protein FJW21_08975 [Acidimicrobiia bacterium]|nr:hypothetical protein [Acidimicrobiia bacterium]